MNEWKTRREIIIQRELVCKVQPQKPHNNKHNIDTAADMLVCTFIYMRIMSIKKMWIKMKTSKRRLANDERDTNMWFFSVSINTYKAGVVVFCANLIKETSINVEYIEFPIWANTIITLK